MVKGSGGSPEAMRRAGATASYREPVAKVEEPVSAPALNVASATIV